MQSSAAVKTFSPQLPRKISRSIFNDWFDIVPAETQELLDRAFQLRYQVYCRERRYEDAGAFRGLRETDSFDNRSAHSLIVSRVDDSVLGTVRLVLADADAQDVIFPMHQICRNSRIGRIRPFSASTTAEISRFAISKAARKPPAGVSGLSGCRSQISGGSSLFSTPSIMLGLMRATMRMSQDHGITDWLAVMEPSLLRLLARFGIYFQPVGQLVEYHGLRQPCQANICLLLERILKEQPDVWEYVTDGGSYLE